MILASSALTLAAAEIAIRFAASAIDRYRVADYDRKPSVLRREGPADIVLMGSSRAKYALVPDEFEAASGLTVYNLGIAGSKVVEWLALARALFERDPPRLVVLGVNASEFRADYLPLDAARHLWSASDLCESLAVEGFSLDVSAAYVRRAAGPLWAACDLRYEIRMGLCEWASPLLPKHAQHARELRERVAAPVPPKGYDHPWLHGRQLRDLHVRLLESPAAVDAASVPAFDTGAAAFARFDQLADWLKARGIGLAVVYLPNSPRTENRWAAVEPLFIDEIAKRCRRRGIPFWPLPAEDVPRANADYLEEVHVGLPLARRISRHTAGRVVAAGLVRPDARRWAGLPQEGDAP